MDDINEIIGKLKGAVKGGVIRTESLSDLVNSMRGITGSGTSFSRVIDLALKHVKTFEPGDLVRSNHQQVSSVPVAHDLWYLWPHCNLIEKYYSVITDGKETFDGAHADYTTYLSSKIDFLARITGLKPLKTIRDIDKQLLQYERYVPTEEFDETKFDIAAHFRQTWSSNGIYWINISAFELWLKDRGMQYPSDGPKNYNETTFDINNYVGYLSFPVGQLGTMEVISLIQETKISGYSFSGGESPSLSGYNIDPIFIPTDQEKPTIQNTILPFADMKDSNGNQLAGKNYCYGKHLLESTYLVPTEATSSNPNTPEVKDVPAASRDFELLSKPMERYLEDVKPKMWMRYWIHRESIIPVPGEFVGILTRAQAIPPHIWWFQDSNPFVYAGNWMETDYFTSGVITEITLEADRPAGSVGDRYNVDVQGCNVIVYATDFFKYAVGERVALVKTTGIDSTGASTDNIKEKKTKSFTWLDQYHFKQTDEGDIKDTYIIVPFTFYKAKKQEKHKRKM